MFLERDQPGPQARRCETRQKEQGNGVTPFRPCRAVGWPPALTCCIVVVGQRRMRVVPVEKQAYREAMARLGAAVNVITTDGPGGRAGFTARAGTSVTDTTPTLLVGANPANHSYPALI